MEYREIDLNEWELSGNGNEGQSYVSKSNPALMLKLYHNGFDIKEAVHELEMARLAFRLGIPTPASGEMVSCGKRIGLIFSNIPGKRSICSVISQQPERLTEMAELFAVYARNLHRTEVTLPHGVVLDDYRDFITGKCFELRDRMPVEARNEIERITEDAPAPDCLNHGDLHFGNLITNGSNAYFIDMGRLKSGTVEFDLSTMYCVCFGAPPQAIESNFHITVAQARRFWHEFINAYYEGKDIARHEYEIRKWAFVRSEFFKLL